MEEPVLRGVVQTAAAEDLMKLKGALEQRLAEAMPVQTQLMGTMACRDSIESGFMI